MAKRLSKDQKELIKEAFSRGEKIDYLAEKFACTKLTITRNLKNFFGESKFKDLLLKSKSNKEFIEQNKQLKNKILKNQGDQDITNTKTINKDILFETKQENDLSSITEFMEIPLLNEEIDNVPRKDLSSISIADMDFPNVVYMIVDKKIELEIKPLGNFPEWQFLPEEDLNRKTIKIYLDMKTAKSNCNKEQKVIKVANTNVFKLASPFLLSRGITRIISEDKLIAL